MGFLKWLLHYEEWELEQYFKIYGPPPQRTEFEEMREKAELERHKLALEFERRAAELEIEKAKKELY